jgi:hypothetical protein
MLVVDLFDLARIEAGVLHPELHDAALDRVTESCLRGQGSERKG